MRRLVAWGVTLLALVAAPVVVTPSSVGAEPFVRRSDPMPWGVTDRLPSSIEDQTELVRDIAISRGRVYVVGFFRKVAPVAGGESVDQPFAAAFDLTTGEWIRSWRPELDGPALEVEVSADGATVVVGGDFTSVAGNPRAAGLAFLDADTGAPLPRSATSVVWSYPRGAMTVDALALNGAYVYVGGNFNAIATHASGRVEVSRLARIELATGRVDRSWRPDVRGAKVAAIAIDQSRNRVYLGGRFDSIGGVRGTWRFATVTLAGGVLVPGVQQGLRTDNQLYRVDRCRPVTPHCRQRFSRVDHYPYDLEVFGGRVALVGDMMVEIMRASDLRSVAAWSRRSAWKTGGCPLDGDVTSAEYADGWLYLGGHFEQLNTGFGGRSCNSGNPRTLMRWRPRTGFDRSFSFSWGSPTPAVWGLTYHERSGILWAGGRFEESGGTEVLNLAKFSPGGVAVDTERPTPPTRLRVTSVTSSSVSLAWEPATDNVGVAGYQIHRSTEDGVLGPVVATTADTTFTDATVQTGTTYYYALKAYDAAGNLSWRTNFKSATP